MSSEIADQLKGIDQQVTSVLKNLIMLQRELKQQEEQYAALTNALAGVELGRKAELEDRDAAIKPPTSI